MTCSYTSVMNVIQIHRSLVLDTARWKEEAVGGSLAADSPLARVAQMAGSVVLRVSVCPRVRGLEPVPRRFRLPPPAVSASRGRLGVLGRASVCILLCVNCSAALAAPSGRSAVLSNNQ